jgi:hypothetical protein
VFCIGIIYCLLYESVVLFPYVFHLASAAVPRFNACLQQQPPAALALLYFLSLLFHPALHVMPCMHALRHRSS